MKNYIKVFILLIFLLLDLIIYIFLRLIILNYEDFYDESKGEYFSLESMTTIEKIGYIGWYIWILINIFLAIYLIMRLAKWFKLKYLNQN